MRDTREASHDHAEGRPTGEKDQGSLGWARLTTQIKDSSLGGGGKGGIYHVGARCRKRLTPRTGRREDLDMMHDYSDRRNRRLDFLSPFHVLQKGCWIGARGLARMQSFTARKIPTPNQKWRL